MRLFLSFIRTAYFWTLVHPELAFEEDVNALLQGNAELADLLLIDKEAGRLEMGFRLFQELNELRGLHEKRDLELAKFWLFSTVTSLTTRFQRSGFGRPA